jgi:hypothetical protein
MEELAIYDRKAMSDHNLTTQMPLLAGLAAIDLESAVILQGVALHSGRGRLRQVKCNLGVSVTRQVMALGTRYALHRTRT